MAKRTEHPVRNLILFFGVCIFISLVVFLVLWGTHVLYIEHGIHFNTELFNDLKGTLWIVPVFIGIQVVVTVLLCFVPGTSASMILAGVALFGSNWKTFLICFTGVILSSVCMDLIGRFGGEKVVKWLVGERNFDSASSLIKDHGYTYLPFMYLLPLFPDDCLCFCAGVMGMSFLYHLLVIVLCRGIGIATIVFGIGFLPYRDWLPFQDHIYDWFVCIGCMVAYIMAILKISVMIDRKVSAKLRKKQENRSKEDKQDGKSNY